MFNYVWCGFRNDVLKKFFFPINFDTRHYLIVKILLVTLRGLIFNIIVVFNFINHGGNCGWLSENVKRYK